MKRRLPAGEFDGQKVLMVGLGLHGGGVATARWLLQHGATLRITDQQTKRQLSASIAKLPAKRISWTLGRLSLNDLRWADLVVQNPGVPSLNTIIQTATKIKKPVLNEAALFFTHSQAKVLGVTGTRGKTTTTLLIAHILKKFHRLTIAAGNLRDVPMMSIVDRLTPRHWAVVELSSFQLEGLAAVRRGPQIAVWTNLLIDHLNRYKNMAAYTAAKSRILRYQSADDVAVLNADSAAVRRLGKVSPAKVLWFSTEKPRGSWSIVLKNSWIIEVRNRQSRKIMPLAAFPLAGDHQRHNLLAAVAACRAAGVPGEVIRRAVPSFPSVPHRQEIVRSWRGHRWINDTTATSPDGAVAAIAAFPNARYILGGTDKRLDFSGLVRVLRKQSGPLIFLPGTATEKILRLLHQKSYRGKIVLTTSMREAVKRAALGLTDGQDVVLTPGAASFGLFRHEFDRGEQFIKEVQALR